MPKVVPSKVAQSMPTPSMLARGSGSRRILAQKDDSAHGALVDEAHLGDLGFALMDIPLIYADGINPDGPKASVRSEKAEQCSAIPGLEQDIPVLADVYRVAKTRVTLFIGPSVGHGFILGAVVIGVGFEGHMNGHLVIVSGMQDEQAKLVRAKAARVNWRRCG